MAEAVLRFVIGGGLVALLPIVSERFGPAVAGVFLLFPAVTFTGLLFLGRAEGLAAVAQTSISAMIGLPAVAAFLLGVHYSSSAGRNLIATLLLGIASWLSVAAPLVLLSQWGKRP